MTVTLETMANNFDTGAARAHTLFTALRWHLSRLQRTPGTATDLLSSVG